MIVTTSWSGRSVGLAPDLPELRLGCIHTGTTERGGMVRIRPTPSPLLWHVSYEGAPQGTIRPVTRAEIPELLWEWDARPVNWTSQPSG